MDSFNPQHRRLAIFQFDNKKLLGSLIYRLSHWQGTIRFIFKLFYDLNVNWLLLKVFWNHTCFPSSLVFLKSNLNNRWNIGMIISLRVAKKSSSGRVDYDYIYWEHLSSVKYDILKFQTKVLQVFRKFLDKTSYAILRSQIFIYSNMNNKMSQQNWKLHMWPKFTEIEKNYEKTGSEIDNTPQNIWCTDRDIRETLINAESIMIILSAEKKQYIS